MVRVGPGRWWWLAPGGQCLGLSGRASGMQWYHYCGVGELHWEGVDTGRVHPSLRHARFSCFCVTEQHKPPRQRPVLCPQTSQLSEPWGRWAFAVVVEETLRSVVFCHSNSKQTKKEPDVWHYKEQIWFYTLDIEMFSSVRSRIQRATFDNCVRAKTELP